MVSYGIWKSAARLVLIAGLTIAGIGCENHPSDQQIQQQTAEATQKAKREAEQAAQQARVAAAEAERRLNDVAAGVRQGLKSGGAPVDINSATSAQLESLPGINPGRARRIIRNRPYADPHELVGKQVLSEDEYDKISGQIVAK